MSPEPEATEDAVSWLNVSAHCPVIASDGTEIGKVLEVAGLANEDIFHGIVFEHHKLGRTFLAPAADVSKITTRAVYLSVDAAAAEQYEEFHEMHIKKLNVRGIFGWKHVGWKDSSE